MILSQNSKLSIIDNKIHIISFIAIEKTVSTTWEKSAKAIPVLEKECEDTCF